MSSGRFRPRRMIGGARERFGSRRRRGYATWADSPDRPEAGSSWWAPEPQWFPAGTPPRTDTAIEILVDGHDVFRVAWEAITQAKHSVWLVDWAMTPEMELVRGEDRQAVAPAAGREAPGYRVFDLLTAMADRVDVRILVWNGTLFFKPRALAARRGVRRLHRANPRVQGQVDKHIHRTHCHHQKTIVVDGTVAFVGGLDMTNFDIDRWDSQQHPVRDGLNWHDLAFRLEGEAAADVGKNFIERWQAVTGERLALPPAEPSGQADRRVPVQIVRTIPAGLYPFAPQGEFGIAWAYRQAFRQARSFIYLENQYLWSPAVVDELIAALHRVEDPAFRIVLVLPARPNIGKRDTDTHVCRLRDADQGRGRVHIFTLYTDASDAKRAWVYKPVYVHAKVAIVDDAWCTLGSANLNERGMATDSELNAQVLDGTIAHSLRLRLWSEHLQLPEQTLASLSAAEAIDKLWVPLGAHARKMIDSRAGRLTMQAVQYDLGDMPGDLSLGELEARLLDA